MNAVSADHAPDVRRGEKIKRERAEGGQSEAGSAHGFLAELPRQRRREHDDDDGRGRAEHVDDAVEHVGHIRAGEVGPVAVDDVAERFEKAAGSFAGTERRRDQAELSTKSNIAALSA